MTDYAPGTKIRTLEPLVYINTEFEPDAIPVGTIGVIVPMEGDYFENQWYDDEFALVFDEAPGEWWYGRPGDAGTDWEVVTDE